MSQRYGDWDEVNGEKQGAGPRDKVKHRPIERTDQLRPNSITLSGSKLVRSWSHTSSKLVADLLARASSLLAS